MNNYIKKIILFFTSITVVSISLILIITSNHFNSLNNEIQRLYQQNDILRYDLLLRMESIRNDIKSEIDKSALNFFDENYDIISIDSENGSATVKIYFSLKEYPASDSVLVVIGEDSYTATKSLNGMFKTDSITLDIDKKYPVKYMLEGSIVKSEKLFDIQIFKFLRDRFIYKIQFNDNSQTKISGIFTNNYGTFENLKLTSIKLKVYSYEQFISEIDMTDKLTENIGTQYLRLDDITVPSVEGIMFRFIISDIAGSSYELNDNIAYS